MSAPYILERLQREIEMRPDEPVSFVLQKAYNELERYWRALTTANGFLIMAGKEPVKLEYPMSTSTNDQTVTSVSGTQCAPTVAALRASGESK